MRTKTTISISEARKRIFDIAEEVQKPGVHYTFTDKGKPKTVMMSFDEFDSLMETLEIMSDPELMRDIRKAEKEYASGEYVTLDELKKELGYSAGPMVLADKGKRNIKLKAKLKQRKRANKYA